jgi:hypothetical protein
MQESPHLLPALFRHLGANARRPDAPGGGPHRRRPLWRGNRAGSRTAAWPRPAAARCCCASPRPSPTGCTAWPIRQWRRNFRIKRGSHTAAIPPPTSLVPAREKEKAALRRPFYPLRTPMLRSLPHGPSNSVGTRRSRARQIPGPSSSRSTPPEPGG